MSRLIELLLGFLARKKASLRAVMVIASLTIRAFHKRISEDFGSIPNEEKHFFSSLSNK